MTFGLAPPILGVSTGSVIGIAVSIAVGTIAFALISGVGVLGRGRRPPPPTTPVEEGVEFQKVTTPPTMQMYVARLQEAMDSGDTGERWLRRIEGGLTDLAEQVDAVNTRVENLTALATNGFNKSLADADLRARQTTKQAWLAFAVGTALTVGGTIASIVI